MSPGLRGPPGGDGGTELRTLEGEQDAGTREGGQRRRSRERWRRTAVGYPGPGPAHVAAVGGALGGERSHPPGPAQEVARRRPRPRRAAPAGSSLSLRRRLAPPPRQACRSGIRRPAASEPMRRLSPATQPSPVMQAQEDGDNLIPFARCSRVVSRSPPPRLPSQSLRLTPQRYGDTFWENLSQRPSPTWREEQYIPPLLRATGCSQPGLYPPEGLPPPEVLCRRKRRRPHLTGMQQGSGGIPARVRAVTYHLEDLRRRQKIINELKQAQWGSSGAASEPLVLDDDGCGLPSTAEHPGLEEERANYPREEDFFLTPGRAQLLWSPWSPLGQERSCLSGRLSSLASFSTVTASRNPLYNPWGVELRSEE
ncbi:LOW QUALITY PROTEIN: protein INCA1 [Hippopotamus amphibius kiboko]|uniref:LOW QUALITY PROTEIN: protein INCA1 n=1 Tax=Hippopotamus amphibius kiboko TaxID=575201 RepID=UPI00259AB0DA|nr:LOW QUALITY PROTEIN: protein INCA1 [Hippopotamus amphibius kiboko]